MRTLRNIDHAEGLRAVADPNRMTILRMLMVRKHTISSIGVAMDKHPAWVRHHVKQLESAGLVALVEERTTRNYTEKFYRACAPAYTVSYLIRPEEAEYRPLVALASHDFAMELLAGDESALGEGIITGIAGSLDALIGVRQGLADFAGCHLLDPDTGEYNVPYARHLFPDRDIVVVTLAHREQGLMVAPGNPLKIKRPADLQEGRARFANRNRGSGTRLWLDRHVAHEGINSGAIVGFDREVATHTEAAALVAAGEADASLGIRAAADQADLDFIPLFQERYDLVIPQAVYDTPAATQMLERLHEKSFRTAVNRISGYDARSTGDEYRLAL